MCALYGKYQLLRQNRNSPVMKCSVVVELNSHSPECLFPGNGWQHIIGWGDHSHRAILLLIILKSWEKAYNSVSGIGCGLSEGMLSCRWVWTNTHDSFLFKKSTIYWEIPSSNLLSGSDKWLDCTESHFLFLFWCLGCLVFLPFYN